MPKTRKSHLPSLKVKVAVEAIKAHKTAAQIAQIFGVHPTRPRAGRNRCWPVYPMTPSQEPNFGRATVFFRSLPGGNENCSIFRIVSATARSPMPLAGCSCSPPRRVPPTRLGKAGVRLELLKRQMYKCTRAAAL
jgi:hypothetical protein